MEGQGNILKTLLIAAVIYALALGVPVKRDTSSSTVAEACAAAANVNKSLTMCSDDLKDNDTWSTYNESSAAKALSKKLTTKNFSEAVCEAVRKCLNHSNFERKKCKLAAAAMELHDTINRFIANSSAQTLPINCSCTSTDEVEVEEPLCYASVYTLDLLAGIDGGDYVSNCASSHSHHK